MINNQNLAVLSEKVAHLESAVKNSDEASGISYDNADSGLTADNVQGAIDEVFAKFSNYISDAVVSGDITFALGVFEITTGGNTLEITGVKVIRNWDSRYTVIGMILSGATFTTNFIAYSSWNDVLIKISS